MSRAPDSTAHHRVERDRLADEPPAGGSGARHWPPDWPSTAPKIASLDCTRQMTAPAATYGQRGKGGCALVTIASNSRGIRSANAVEAATFAPRSRRGCGGRRGWRTRFEPPWWKRVGRAANRRRGRRGPSGSHVPAAILWPGWKPSTNGVLPTWYLFDVVGWPPAHSRSIAAPRRS
jgi:hypothetical protein